MTKHSSHIFLFPFSFEKSFTDVIKNMELRGRNWDQQNFNANGVDRQNQHVYFHDYAEEILFNSNSNVKCFEYSGLGSNSQYSICLLDNGVKRVFNLNLNKVTLNIYNTHVGVLSFFLDNYTTEDREDILKINDFGRRLFPQFVTGGENSIAASQNSFLPVSITITRDEIPAEIIINTVDGHIRAEKDVITYEDFSYYRSFGNNIASVSQKQTRLPDHIIKLLGEECFCDESCVQHGLIKIKPVIDDRMFVISGYVNAVMDTLKQFSDGHYTFELWNNQNWINLSTKEADSWGGKVVFSKDEMAQRKELDFWYRYLFIDTNQATCQSLHQITGLIKEHTYDRWVNWGKLYGISRYSFVLLASSQFEFDTMLDKHLNNLYYYMALLCIVERSSILQFSERVSLVSGFKDPKQISKAEIDRVSELYYDYINFINRVYLREITAQEQGIELYNMLMEKMNIKNEVENLDNEISELHTYVSLIEDRKRNIRMAELNILAVFFIPASLIAAILGVGFIGEGTGFDWFGTLDTKMAKSLWLIFAGGLLISIVYYLLSNFKSIMALVFSAFSNKKNHYNKLS